MFLSWFFFLSEELEGGPGYVLCNPDDFLSRECFRVFIQNRVVINGQVITVVDGVKLRAFVTSFIKNRQNQTKRSAILPELISKLIQILPDIFEALAGPIQFSIGDGGKNRQCVDFRGFLYIDFL